MTVHATRLAALAFAAALATPAAEAAEPALGVTLGVAPGEIADALAADGWEMTKYERENGRIEVYAVKEDRRVEAKLDPATGEVVAVEARLRRGRGPVDSEADDRLRAELAAQGYAIRKMERGRGRIEVYAEKDGRLWEIEADAATGEIRRIEEED